MFSPAEILSQSIEKGTAKTKNTLMVKLILGFLGGR